MAQEDKELLLIDLSARLRYGVKGIITYDKSNTTFTVEGIDNNVLHLSDAEDCYVEDFKPYLRPLSSMTEEEKEELKSKCIHTETEEDWEGVRSDVWGIQILDKYDTRRWDNPIWPSTINMDAIDWLNAHHFDYRGLIEKGLALEAPEGMYD